MKNPFFSFRKKKRTTKLHKEVPKKTHHKSRKKILYNEPKCLYQFICRYLYAKISSDQMLENAICIICIGMRQPDLEELRLCDRSYQEREEL